MKKKIDKADVTLHFVKLFSISKKTNLKAPKDDAELERELSGNEKEKSN